MESRIIRNCSYDPSGDCILVQYDANESRMEQYLEVKFREYWFHVYCEERNLRGRIEVGDLNIERYDDRILVSTVASVYIDDVLAARTPAARFVEIGNSDGIQGVVTLAKGRALNLAGFGTISACNNEDGELYPVDSGIAITRNPENPNEFIRQTRANNPLLDIRNSTSGAAAKSEATEKTASTTAATEVQKDPIEVSSLSKEALFNYKVPINGANAGKTMSELMATRPDAVKWYATEFTPRTTEAEKFKAICQRVLDIAGL